nr:cell wall-binding protein [Clostridium chromiireducens]
MVKKLVCGLLIVLSMTIGLPMGVSAEWKRDNSGWKYTDGSSYSYGWKQINGSWYYFGNDGYMQKGWVLDKAWWYYLQDRGAMAIGKLAIGNKTYEFDNNGRWINNSIYSGSTVTNTEGESKPPSQEKFESAPDFSWVNEDGNTYFKITEDYYVHGAWNIDGDIYEFDKNGVMQKGEYTALDGKKYLFGDDGKFIKGITNPQYKLWVAGAITTKSTTDNFGVKLDDSNMMSITDTYSEDSEKGSQINDIQSKATVEGRTLNCKVGQYINLGAIDVSSEDTEKSSFPNLIIISSSTDSSIAYSAVDISMEDGYFRHVTPQIAGLKPGKVTITLYINGATTSYDVVVTE